MGTFQIEDNAWDILFGNENIYYINVVLKDGKEFYGLYQKGSIASSDKDFRDLYLKNIFVKDNDEWVPNPVEEGLWVSCKEVQYLKIIPELSQAYDGGDKNGA